MRGLVPAQCDRGRIACTAEIVSHAAVVQKDEPRVRVLRDDDVEVRPREPQRPQHEIEVPGPESGRKSLDVALRARLEAAQGWAAREQVDDLGLELVLTLGFQEPLDERSPPGFVGSANAARVPHSN